MDKEIKPKNRFLKKAAVAIAGAAIIAAAIYAITRIGDNTYKADADSVAIAEVTSGIFNDCIRLNGRVETGVTVQVSALETGIVDRRWVEECAMVKEGDIILTLHNPNLRQQILDSESQLAEKQNMLRDTELAMEKERLQVRQDILSTRTDYSRKQLNELTDFVKRPQIGAKGLVFIKYNADGTVKSSIDKFYTPEQLAKVKETTGAKDGDLVLILCGDKANKTRTQLCTLRLEMGDRLGLRSKDKFECLWIVDFPLFEWSDEEQRLMATHHPFTMPNPDDIPLLEEHCLLYTSDAADE